MSLGVPFFGVETSRHGESLFILSEGELKFRPFEVHQRQIAQGGNEVGMSVWKLLLGMEPFEHGQTLFGELLRLRILALFSQGRSELPESGCEVGMTIGKFRRVEDGSIDSHGFAEVLGGIEFVTKFAVNRPHRRVRGPKVVVALRKEALFHLQPLARQTESLGIITLSLDNFRQVGIVASQ